jgi:hypothetical protein
MHRTLAALIVAALASGALLLVATVTLDAWHWRLYNEAQALQPSVEGLVAAAAENPYQLGRSATTYFQIFVGCCAATTFWVVFVVLPGLLAARRMFAGVLASHIIAAIVACIVSGITFTLMQRVTPYISPMITFAAGGTIGLVSTILLAKMLPPNVSLERTRER